MADVDFVNSLYRNVLAREPDGDASGWISRINDGATYDQVTAAFISSTEVQTFINPVVRLYEGLLNRPPDAAGLNDWANQLRAGAPLTNIIDGFLNSPEGALNGFSSNPAIVNNETFVNNLYLGMGRTEAQIVADPDGVSYWLNALDTETMSRAQVAQGFMELAENHQGTDGFVTGWAALRLSPQARRTR